MFSIANKFLPNQFAIHNPIPVHMDKTAFQNILTIGITAAWTNKANEGPSTVCAPSTSLAPIAHR